MNIEELVRLIGINKSYFVKLAYNSDKCYNVYYKRKKSGGTRRIEAPNQEIKGIQNWILQKLLYPIEIDDNAHGFRLAHSIKTNATCHLGKNYILCLDIKNFFPSINFQKVNGIFQKIVDDTYTAYFVTKLCTFESHVPQGAVTSPYISNIAFKEIDKKISDICQLKRVIYTRYADDLTFSSNNFQRLKDVKIEIENIIKDTCFSINIDKTRFMSPNGKLMVTGLTLNSNRLSIGRFRKKELRAKLHNYFIKKNEEININNVIGILAFLKDIEPTTYNYFLNYIVKLKNKM